MKTFADLEQGADFIFVREVSLPYALVHTKLSPPNGKLKVLLPNGDGSDLIEQNVNAVVGSTFINVRDNENVIEIRDNCGD